MNIYLYGDSISRGYGLGQFDHPSPINSIWGIANLLTIENGRADVQVIWRGHQDAQRFWLDRYENIVNAGSDVFVFENAGPHFALEPYKAWLTLWRLAAGSSKLYFTTTPSLKPVGNINNYRDVNILIRQEAVGVVKLLDWEATFERLESQTNGYSLFQPDGIHFSAWGNFVAAVSILGSQGVSVESVNSIAGEFEQYYSGVVAQNVLTILSGE